ncbi:MAG: methylmalonyl Co-A mutase-associated GTPase MeaB [bacterium]
MTVEVDALSRDLQKGDRRALAQAITLVESRHPAHEDAASRLLAQLLPRTGAAYRIGVTGPPGVGKSTFIDAFGSLLVAKGKRVSVLAVDPSSAISGGSLLGDKTRMPSLAASERAFIRPSPNAASPGGVARRTRETMLVCEAAGYDPVLVETVGVGQAEIDVREMVDVFLLLAQPGGGDELQGMKRGIFEMADVVVVTKADGEQLARARETAAQYSAAMRIVATEGSPPAVVMVSAKTGEGLEALWTLLAERRAELAKSGALESRRVQQRVAWMWRLVDEALLSAFREHPAVRESLAVAEEDVRAGRITPDGAAARLLVAYRARGRPERA